MEGASRALLRSTPLPSLRGRSSLAGSPSTPSPPRLRGGEGRGEEAGAPRAVAFSNRFQSLQRLHFLWTLHLAASCTKLSARSPTSPRGVSHGAVVHRTWPENPGGVAIRARDRRRRAQRPGDRLLRGDDRQRLERRHDGRALRHPAEGRQHRGGGRHGLHPRRDLHHHDAGHQRCRSQLHEERDVGHSSINYFAYQGETPVFDFSNMVISTTGYTHGFVVNASWLHFKGLEIRSTSR